MRQLLIHRHKLVEIRTRVKNGLQHLMLNRGVQKKRKLWSAAGQQALRELPLQGWAAQRRQDLLILLKSLDEQIGELDRATEAVCQRDKMVLLLRGCLGSRRALIARYLPLIDTSSTSKTRVEFGGISGLGLRSP